MSRNQGESKAPSANLSSRAAGGSGSGSELGEAGDSDGGEGTPKNLNIILETHRDSLAVPRVCWLTTHSTSFHLHVYLFRVFPPSSVIRYRGIGEEVYLCVALWSLVPRYDIGMFVLSVTIWGFIQCDGMAHMLDARGKTEED